MRLDKDKIKESLTKDHIDAIMSDLGSLPPKKDGSDNPVYTTVCHGGNSQKLYYYADSDQPIFRCYTGCAKNMDIYEVVIRAKETQNETYSFTDALSYVANITGQRIISDQLATTKNSISSDWDWISKLKPRPQMTQKLPVYNESVLEKYLHLPHESWVQEGISHESMENSGICFDSQQNAIIIPHRSIHGDLVGIRQRNMELDQLELGRKYVPTFANNKLYNHRLMYNLYHLNRSKDAIKRSGKVVIFEGEKSCLLSNTFYGDYDYSVSVCGNTVSSWHVRQLLKLGVKEIVLAFDKEYTDHESPRAIEYSRRLRSVVNQFIKYTNVSVLWDTENLLDEKDAPIDKGQEAFEILWKNRIKLSM